MPLIIEIDVGLFNVLFRHFVRFICIALSVFVIFRAARRRFKQPLLPGIWFFALLLAAASLYDLLNFLDFNYHRRIFAQLPYELFKIRYTFSICLRLVLVATGFGLIWTKEWARKTAVLFGVFTVATIYWKHPFYVFENIAIMIEQQQTIAAVTQLQYPVFPWINMLLYVTADLVFAGLLIYYFTLSSTISAFKHDIPTQKTSSAAQS